jgi:hypothetical protein
MSGRATTGVFARFGRRAGSLLAITLVAGGLIAAAPADATLLYDQYNNASSAGTSSQEFEASFEGYDDQLADDFVVPAGNAWNINEVIVQGQYFAGVGPAESFNVYFYANSGGNLPGSPVASRTGNSFANSSGEFSILLGGAVTLVPGTYWLAVQARQDYEGGKGQWMWQDREVQSNHAAAWENPNNGFATGCTTWVLKTSCVGTTAPDQVFKLTGTTIAAPQGIYVAERSSGSITPGVTDVGVHCDDCTASVAFPFAVRFYGETYSGASVSSNGSLQFGGASPSFSTSCPLPDQRLTGSVMAFQADFTTNAAGDGIFTATAGSAPHRTFVIEWRGHYFGSLTKTANFELQLHEDSPVVTAIYGATDDSGAGGESGVQGAANGPSTQFSCNTAALTKGLRVDYVPNPRTLTVTKSGSGTGTVTSSPEGMDCGSICSHAFSGGGNVTLTASPAAGSSFAGWSGAGCSGTATCIIKLDADTTVTATFTTVAPPVTPPDTKITKARISQSKDSAKFKFKAVGSATGFQCSLAKLNRHRAKQSRATFSNCRSPKSYKHLKPGKYVFKVRAIGPGGTDPSPAKKAFSINP